MWLLACHLSNRNVNVIFQLFMKVHNGLEKLARKDRARTGPIFRPRGFPINVGHEFRSY